MIRPICIAGTILLIGLAGCESAMDAKEDPRVERPANTVPTTGSPAYLGAKQPPAPSIETVAYVQPYREPDTIAPEQVPLPQSVANANGSPAYLTAAPLPSTPVYSGSYGSGFAPAEPVLTQQVSKPTDTNAVTIKQPSGAIADRCDPKNWIDGRPPYGINCSSRIRRIEPDEEVLPFEVLSDGAYVRIDAVHQRDTVRQGPVALESLDVDVGAAPLLGEIPVDGQEEVGSPLTD